MRICLRNCEYTETKVACLVIFYKQEIETILTLHNNLWLAQTHDVQTCPKIFEQPVTSSVTFSLEQCLQLVEELSSNFSYYYNNNLAGVVTDHTESSLQLLYVSVPTTAAFVDIHKIIHQILPCI